jgi:UDP-glucose 4-epimerase
MSAAGGAARGTPPDPGAARGTAPDSGAAHATAPGPGAARAEAPDLGAAFAGRAALVTGGLGFIGSNLSRRLVGLGAHVTLMDALLPGNGGNRFNVHDLEGRVDVRIADVRDRAAMDALVRGQDFLFNLAGQVSHIDSMRDPFTDLDINCRSQLSILESCRQNNRGVRIVFAASRQEYGRPQYLPVDEHHPVLPVDVNGINKVAGERYHLVYNDVYGIRATSLRLTNTYGPGQLLRHNRQGFIGWFIRTVVEGGEIQLYGDGSQLRDLNHVDDVVEAFLLAGAALDRDAPPAGASPAASASPAGGASPAGSASPGCASPAGRFYNLAAEPPISLAALAGLLVELAGRGTTRLVPWPEEKKPIDIGSYYGSHARITEELGWTPRVALRDGLLSTIRYYERHLGHYVA